MQPSFGPTETNKAFLQILIFVDKRPICQEQTQQIYKCLEELRENCEFDIEEIDVGEKPYLAEHFKLIATPTLIKLYPEPRQILTGTNLVMQIRHCWPRWLQSVHKYLEDQTALTRAVNHYHDQPRASSAIAFAGELIQISDQVFQLKQEIEELQSQVQFKDRIISMLAHDIRNPLTSASLAIETLELSQNLDEQNLPRLTPAFKEGLLKQARCQLRLIDRLITDILDAARGENNELQIQPQKIKLGDLCKQIIDEFTDRLVVKSLQLGTDIPHGLPVVYADPEKIRQVISNLLDNAIKYTPDHGKIHIAILERTTQKIQVTITDNGPGIPASDRDTVFEDHFRLQRDHSLAGYGLGLALCRRIINAHFGKIWVEDNHNQQGASFHFTLPIYR